MSSDSSAIPEEDPFSEIFEYEGYRYPAYLPTESSKWVELSPGKQLTVPLRLPNGQSTSIVPPKEDFKSIIDVIPQRLQHKRYLGDSISKLKIYIILL